MCIKCHGSTELASNLLQEHYDIYLLDVVMPGLNGIELAKEIRSSDKAADIIFLTSSPEFAVESYTVKASNYLVKPVSRDRLVEALDDIMRTRTEDRDSCLVLKSSVGVHKVHMSEIIYIVLLFILPFPACDRWGTRFAAAPRSGHSWQSGMLPIHAA